MNRTIIITITILFALAARAQRVSHAFENVTMPAALKTLNTLQDKYTINFIYDELEDFRTSADIRNLSVPDAIRQLIGFYPITMTVTDDKFISVECTQKTARRYKGRLVDEHREPVAYANVVLLSPTDSSIIANGVSSESGNFVIPCEAQCVLVRISYVGYRTLLRTCTNPVIGTLQLQPEARTLGGVVVKGQRPQYKMAKGGMTVDVEHSLLSQAGTASDVLAQLPRVNVDSKGDVSVFAKGTPLVYINNKQVHDNNELRQLKSTEIKTIDIITSPGAQYDATVDAVIRIKTIKKQGEGFSLRNDANATYKSKWMGWEDLDLRYRTGKLEVFGDLYWENIYYREDNTLANDIYAGSNHITSQQKVLDDIRNKRLTGKTGFTYDLDENNSIGASYKVQRTLNSTGYMNGTQTITRNDSLEGTVIQKIDLGRMEGPNHEYNVYYNGKVGRLGIDVNGTYLWNKTVEDNIGTEQSEELENRTVHSHGSQHNRMVAGKLVLSYPVSKGDLNIGSEYSHTNANGEYVNQERYVDPSRTRVCESNLAGFAEYTLSLGDFSLDAGLRYEHVKTDYYSFGVWEKEPSRRYSNFFPNASVAWNRKGWSLQLSCSEKTHRPSYRLLRNYIQYDNRYTYEGGNPYLRPEIVYNVEMNMLHTWLSLSAGYNYIKDVMAWTTTLYKDQEASFLTDINFGHQQQVYASLVASPKFGWYQPQLEVDYNQTFFNAREYGSSRNLCKPNFSFEMKNRFDLGNDLMAMLSVTTLTDQYDGFVKSKSYSSIAAQVSKSFLNKSLTVSVNARDIFKTEKERWTMYGLSVIMNKDCYNYTQRVGITITYNLNATRSKYKGTGAGNDEKKRL
jgi:hypothetical protein